MTTHIIKNILEDEGINFSNIEVEKIELVDKVIDVFHVPNPRNDDGIVILKSGLECNISEKYRDKAFYATSDGNGFVEIYISKSNDPYSDGVKSLRKISKYLQTSAAGWRVAMSIPKTSEQLAADWAVVDSQNGRGSKRSAYAAILRNN